VLYPNPANEYIYIQPAKKGFSFVISNAIGQQITSKNTLNGAIEIDHLVPGIYFISIFNGETAPKRVFKWIKS